MEVAGIGIAKWRPDLSRLLPPTEELVSFTPRSIRQLFFVQDVEFVHALSGDLLAQFAIDTQHSERASKNDAVFFPPVGLQDAEEAFRESHHPAIAEWIKCQIRARLGAVATDRIARSIIG